VASGGKELPSGVRNRRGDNLARDLDLVVCRNFSLRRCNVLTELKVNYLCFESCLGHLTPSCGDAANNQGHDQDYLGGAVPRSLAVDARSLRTASRSFLRLIPKVPCGFNHVRVSHLVAHVLEYGLIDPALESCCNNTLLNHR
jgi:hypothetical protein